MKRKRQMSLCFALAVAFFATRAASAADWRYCLASLHAQKTMYVSGVFPSDQALSTTETAFGRELDRGKIQHDSVQCPRGDAQTISAKRAQAIRFNQTNGNKVVEIDWHPVRVGQ
jgi:hypothetical protein